MANFARIQNRIYYGYGKAAQRLGTSHAIYRSVDGVDPIEPANFIFNQLISLDNNYTYKQAKKYGDPVWQFLPENGLLLQNYDYLVSPTGINYFIVDVVPDDRLNPPTCVECNSIVSVFKPSNEPLTPGKNNYQEFHPNGDVIISNCPASVLQHGRMDSNNMKLPTSYKMPYYNILLPDFDGIVIQTGCILTDSEGRRLSVISAEKTKKSLGLRIIAGEQGA